VRPLVSLSLVVAAKGDCHVADFNAAVAGWMGVEVLVVQDRDGALDAPLAPGVDLHRLTTEGSVFDLWGEGISLATGDYVAILDIHCPPGPGWIAAVQTWLAKGADAAFGPVEPAYDWDDPRIVGYLTEYVQFHRPIAADMREVAGNNLILRRDLAGSPETLRKDGFVKTHLLPSLPETPRLLPEALVLHAKPMDLAAYYRRRYLHGRCFAAQRGLAPVRRVITAMATILLPFVRVARAARHTQRLPQARAAFWRFLPQIFIAESAWSFGECLGYLAGEGGCRPRLD
jgi:hypothetical protein